MRSALNVLCPTCRVPRGVACRRVRLSDHHDIAAWFETGYRPLVKTHRARIERADQIALRRRK